MLQKISSYSLTFFLKPFVHNLFEPWKSNNASDNINIKCVWTIMCLFLRAITELYVCWTTVQAESIKIANGYNHELNNKDSTIS